MLQCLQTSNCKPRIKANDLIGSTPKPDKCTDEIQKALKMVRDTGFEPVTPTVSR